MVDTFGFDDTLINEREIFQGFVAWLAETYSKGIYLSGIIFLHPITAVRMSSNFERNMSICRRLCGEKDLAGIVLATTFWDRGNSDSHLRVEHELISEDKFWARPIAQGSKVFRVDSGYTSAEKIISYLVQRKQKVILEIQKDIVDRKLALEQTAAGRRIQDDRDRKLSSLEEELNELSNELDVAASAGDSAWNQEIHESMKEINEKILALK